MNISYTLIVALMFITILSFGIANLLSSMAEILNNKKNTKVTIVHLNWIVILLILHFNMAWAAVLLATVKSWPYGTFLFIVLGPILAFFTASIIAPCATDDKKPVPLRCWRRLSAGYTWRWRCVEGAGPQPGSKRD